jgi:hypothetical protein
MLLSDTTEHMQLYAHESKIETFLTSHRLNRPVYQFWSSILQENKQMSALHPAMCMHHKKI